MYYSHHGLRSHRKDQEEKKSDALLTRLAAPRTGAALTFPSEQPDIQPGDIKFYDNYIPVLLDGDYQITLTPTLTAPGIPSADQDDDLKPVSQMFSVSGPRFVLSNEDIHAFSPAPQSIGAFDTHLPHLVLTKRALPWERAFNSPKKNSGTPWLALFVFTLDELQKDAAGVAQALHQEPMALDSTGSFTGKVDDLTSKSDVIARPQLTPEIADDKNMPCCFIRLSLSRFRQVAPQLSELSYLAHGRQINTGDKEILGLKDDGWFSVVVANRFPQAPLANTLIPLQNVAHLVSLEGCESYFPDSTTPTTASFVQLVSLARWSFQCAPKLPENENFGALMTQIINNSPRDGALLRIILPADNGIPSDISLQLNNGYMPLPYHMRTGEETLGWYRGPFIPLKSPDNTALPVVKNAGTSDSFLIYDEKTGVFDVSYATAWQHGRTLGLADGQFVQMLIEQRRQIHQQTAHLAKIGGAAIGSAARTSRGRTLFAENLKKVVETVPTHLTMRGGKNKSALALEEKALPRSKPQALRSEPRLQLIARQNQLETAVHNAADNLDSLISWVANARQLIGTPFYYLVADEKLLPPESIRFFYVDSLWLDTLTKGILSVGVHTQQDQKLNETLLQQWNNPTAPAFKATDPACGFLLRSAVVSGWPGLAVRINNDPPVDPSIPVVRVLRQERLSATVLLCLLGGIPRRISICEPQEQLCFGVSGDSLESSHIALRNLAPGQMGAPFSSPPTSIAPTLRPEGNRVLDLTTLQVTLLNKGVLPHQAALSSSDWAVELLRSPEEVHFDLTTFFSHPIGDLSMLSSTPTTLESTHALVELSNPFPLTPPVQLNYTLSTPNPVQISQAATISMVVSDPNAALNSPNLVSVSEIGIGIPIGDGFTTLTPNGGGITCSVSDKEWLVSDGEAKASSSTSLIKAFSITPKVTPSPLPQVGLTINLNVESINAIVGCCNLQIIEKLPSSTRTQVRSENEIKATTALSVYKTKGGSSPPFPFDNFRVRDDFQVMPGSAITLLWHWQGGPDTSTTTLTLTRDDLLLTDLGQPGKDPTHPGRITYDAGAGEYPNDAEPQDSPIIIKKGIERVTFTLKADMNINGKEETRSFAQQMSVTVMNPAISEVMSDTDKLYLGGTVSLTWTAKYIDYCSLYINLPTGEKKSIAEKIDPQADGSYTYVGTPQQTTTYYVSGYKSLQPIPTLLAFKEGPQVKVYVRATVMPDIYQGDCWGITLTADESKLYVHHPINDNLSVIDLIANPPKEVPPLISIIQAGASAISADGLLYGLLWQSDNTGAVPVFNLTANPPGKMVSLMPNLVTEPSTIALAPDGAYLCVADSSGNNVSAIQSPYPLTGSRIFTILNQNLTALALTVADGARAGTRLYTAQVGGSILVISLLPQMGGPFTFQISPRPVTALALKKDETRLYVAYDNNTISCFDLTVTPPREMLPNISINNTPRALALTADGSKLYVTTKSGVTPIEFKDRLIPELPYVSSVQEAKEEKISTHITSTSSNASVFSSTSSISRRLSERKNEQPTLLLPTALSDGQERKQERADVAATAVIKTLAREMAASARPAFVSASHEAASSLVSRHSFIATGGGRHDVPNGERKSHPKADANKPLAKTNRSHCSVS